jgi:hypothetical protein
MMKQLPSRDEIARMLRALSAGKISREEASAWAMVFVLDDDYAHTDESAWETICVLGGADILDSDNTFLYNSLDFDSWLEMLG